MLKQSAKEKNTSLAESERQFMATERPESLIKRLLDPAEVANMVVYACSEQASGTSGAPLRVEGGLLRGIS